MDMLSRLERVFGVALDARKGMLPRELAETDVGRSLQSWWNDSRWDHLIKNVVPPWVMAPGLGHCLKSVSGCFW